MIKEITLPLTKKDRDELCINDIVYLSGELLVMRDAAHKLIYEALCGGDPLPVSLNEAAIYYMGPTPTTKGHVIGSAGPTTSKRMDKYTPLLLQNGVKVLIGKGERSTETYNAIRAAKAVYFSAIGGAGAYYSSRVIKAETIAYPELLSEAILKITVEKFPLVVSYK